MAKGDASVALGGTKGLGLKGLKAALQKRIVKNGVTKTVQPVNKAVKAACPVRDAKDIQGGTLKKSLGYKVDSKKSGFAKAVIGARRGYKRQVGVIKTGPNAGTPVMADPAKYLHLVEYGTRNAPATRFVKRTWIQQKRQAMATFARVVREEIKKEAAKVRKR